MKLDALRRQIFVGTHVPRRHVSRRARTLIKVFYIATMLEGVRHFAELRYLARLDTLTLCPPGMDDVLVPVAPLLIILLLLTIGAAGVAAWRPGYRLARSAVVMGLMGMVSMSSVVGNTSHERYGWLWCAIVLAIAPLSNDRTPRLHREQDILAVWLMQLMTSFIYGLSGLWKFVGSFWQAWTNALSTFEINGVCQLVGSRRLLGDAPLWPEAWLPPDTLLWIGFWVVAIAEMSVPIVVLCYPRLHRPLALCLLVFHTLTYALLGIVFWAQMVLVALLFCLTPWQATRAYAFHRR